MASAKTEAHDHGTTRTSRCTWHLGQLMQQRKQADADSSYVASYIKRA
jgi:phosphoribosyl-ATP pyrophosphohydrolase/phosphoribosyl-AMP cyclohydrolase